MNRPTLLSFVVWVVLSAVTAAPAWAQAAKREPHTFFRERIKLSDAEIKQIEQGKIVAKILDLDDRTNIMVFGAVYVNSTIEDYLKVYRDVNALEKEEVYLAVRKFSDPPQLSDVARLELENDDIDNLAECKPGDCDVQIMDPDRTRSAIDWKSKDRYAQFNKYVRTRVVEGVKQYQSGGLTALGSYRDMKHELNLQEAMKAMVDQSGFLTPSVVPEFYNYVLNYPEATLEGAEDLFYWEKLDFGLDVTVRVNHSTIYTVPEGDVKDVKYIVANKQLYATHYFRVALELYVCIQDTQYPNKPGFFLVSLSNSRLPDYGGLKLRIVRKVATSKGLDSANDILGTVLKRLAETRLRAVPK